MFRRIFGGGAGGEKSEDVARLDKASSFSEIDHGARKVVYESARALIRKTTQEHDYQLVVLDATDESDLEEQSYLLSKEIHFQLLPAGAAGSPIFTWLDLAAESKSIKVAELTAGDQSQMLALHQFELAVIQCVWSRANQQSWDAATDEQLDAVKKEMSAVPASRGGKGSRVSAGASGQASERSAEALASSVSGMRVGSKRRNAASNMQPKAKPGRKGKKSAKKVDEGGNVESATSATTSSQQEQQEQRAGSISPVDTFEDAEQGADTVPLITTTADLYIYDPDQGLFMTREKGVTAEVFESGRFLYSLLVSTPDKVWVEQPMTAEMNMSFAAREKSAVWNFFDSDRACYSWLLRFSDADRFDEFQRGFARLLWEALNEDKWEKAKVEEQKYVIGAYDEDAVMSDAQQSDGDDRSETERAVRDDDEEDEVAAALGEEEEEEPDAGNIGDQLDRMPIAADDHDSNSRLAVGYKFDRSFVVRGNRIGVFKHNEDDQLEFATTIDHIATPKGRQFNPGKVLLHDQDSAMVLMDPSNAHAVYKMDLEYGKVVEEWKVHDDVQVENVVPHSKYAQTTAEQTLVGHSHNGIYRIDPRLAGLKLVDGDFKQYATKNDFSAAATDEKGRLAIASNKGDIRLFDKIGKNAKTALPALGDPILGVDVTADGRYVVATCKTYLLLIDTLIGDGKYRGELGFDRAFPAASKPIPRRLQLKPHHVAYMDQEVSFTPAKFDTPIDGGETSIVSATGAYVVSWPLERVKRGKVDGYTLRKLADQVVEDSFAFGSSDNIIVAMPQDVQRQTKGELRKPTRSSLAGGARSSGRYS
ncbi:VID27-domain-containing protein [Ceraceosorus guamensis]|uniref:VID27-domain-containing protein n=1 Tax=Ceraceosorus guamensis TaxID=1522189 RepID=A0A316VW91_9BASI|nr:VID27-domain-containing protein [Ceraceosorus guamensis]PWN41709.1 VID27-domain-containing protein [Ceraceosorus guamensis]